MIYHFKAYICQNLKKKILPIEELGADLWGIKAPKIETLTEASTLNIEEKALKF